jgi:hypothetical protein
VANFEFKSEAVAREFMRINGIEAKDEKKAEEAKGNVAS